MSRWQSAYLAACAAVCAGSICYVLSDFGGWPKLMYEPYRDSWVVAETPPSSTSMVYPGMLLWALAAAVVAAAVVLLVSSRVRRDLGPAALRLVGGWAATASVFAGGYFLWGLWPF